VDPHHKSVVLPCTLSVVDGKNCSVVAPLTLPLNVYEIRLYGAAGQVPIKDQVPDYEKLTSTASVLVRVIREVTDSPTLTSVSPLVAYPNPAPCASADASESVDLMLTGRNYSLAGDDNHILLGGSLANVCWEGNKCTDCAIHGIVQQGGRVIRLNGVPVSDYRGIVTVAVEMDGDKTDDKTVTISWVGESTPRGLAIALTLAVLFVLRLVLGRPSGKQISGQGYSRMSSLMMDNETNTYSLSKFQLYLWTLVAVLAYFYLTLARSLVQGRFGFADIPGSLASILLVSAGTSVLATGITAAKGAKAAGQIQPSWTDLLTVGGVVVPERMQFLVWTVVGAITFLLLTLSIGPGSIREVPEIPQTFLYLMGASSAGYLGGKAARKPGPVIYTAVGKLQMVADPAHAGQQRRQLTIDVTGKNMARDPGVRTGERQINWSETDAQRDATLTRTADETFTDGSFAKAFTLTIVKSDLIDLIRQMQQPAPAENLPMAAPVPQPQITRKPKISITNLDGQMAESEFEIRWNS
jgi:hypothetical protein